MAYESETDVIARAARGEPRAAAALVHQHMPRLYALAYRMLRDKEDAEDVTQEAFLKAWKILPDWEPRARLSTWLYRVTLNLCRDRLRKSRETIMAEPPEAVDTSLKPDQALSKQQSARAVEAAIAALPERQRAAITLCGLQEMSNIEAAEIMEVSIEALESLLARARRGLKAKLIHREDLRP